MRPRTRRAAMTLAGLRTLLAAEEEDLLYVAAPVTERGLGYGSDSVGRLALIALVPLCVFSDGRGGRSTRSTTARVARRAGAGEAPQSSPAVCTPLRA